MKKLTGVVTSTKNKNTLIVEVERYHVHPLYEKRVKKTKRYAVHDTLGVKDGDSIEFIECKPISKTKRWIISQVVSDTKKDKKQASKDRKPTK